jgi:hypothetical protein
MAEAVAVVGGHVAGAVPGAHGEDQQITRLREHRTLGIEATFEVAPIDAGPLQAEGIRSPDVAALVGTLSGAQPRSLAYVRLLAEQAPNRESRVVLTGDLDPLGVPRAELAWRPTRDDRESMRTGMAIRADELGRNGVGRLQVGVGGIGFKDLDHPLHVQLIQGPPASVITDAAEQGAHDLIAIGTHGHRGFRRLLLGSVAESVIRHAPCSVLVAHSEHAGDTSKFKKV